MPSPRGKKTHTSYWSDYWEVSTQTIRNWDELSVPYTDPKAMGKWAIGQQTIPDGVKKVLKKLENGAHSTGTEISAEDPDWADYQKAKAEKIGDGKTVMDGATDTLEEHQGLYAFKLARATQRGNERDAKFFTAQLITFNKAIRENKILAEKLGVQSGEMIAKEAVERWLRAWAFWTMRDLDAMLAEVCPRVAGLAAGLTVDMVRANIEPALLEARMLRPFAMATKMATPLSLPSWMVETVKDAIDDYLERGAEIFEDEMKQKQSAAS